MSASTDSGRDRSDGPSTPPREEARPAPPKLPGTEQELPRKAAKPPKPRKVEKRQRGRKG